jgi:rfaE bifunctional protein nucleotidyltransferase chain/domain
MVFTNGVFDLLHRGHVEYLEKASTYGDILIIGVNSDNSAKRLKGENRPINADEDRAYLLASLSFVDYICIFDEDTPLELIKAIEPDILIKGSDYQPDQIIGRDIVEKRGGKVLTIPLIKGRSTTDLIKRINRLAEQQ